MPLARVRGPGEPNQACDLVAAAIVEEYLRRDPGSKLDIRVSGGRGVLFVVGDVATSADFDVSAVVRRTLGQCGVAAAIEPFIALEPMLPGWATDHGAREPVSVYAYATSETADRFPPAVTLARRVAGEMERRRTSDQDWYWLGSDYEVFADVSASVSRVFIRAEHVETHTREAVREALRSVIQPLAPDTVIQVNAAGDEARAGLPHRVGSGRYASSLDAYGSHLPAHRSGIGLHAAHPLNAGAWLARAWARNLVHEGRGKAAWVSMTWGPLETRPTCISARNERGDDLSVGVDSIRFDVAQLPEAYRAPVLGTMAIRSVFDASVTLPWES